MFPYPIKEVQYYINNTCNLTCRDCLSFNNFKLQGHYTWKQHESQNRKWAELILPQRVSILGGEPFLNPDLINWINGIYEVWNGKTLITVTTNGTLLGHPKQRLIWKRMIDLGVVMEITPHCQEHYDDVVKIISNFFLQEMIDYSIKNHYNSYTGSYDKIAYVDKKNKRLLITLEKSFQFENRTIKNRTKDLIIFYKNDSNSAHENCSINQCHYIVEGKLYKCVVVATWKQLNKKIPIDSESFLELDKYSGCDPFDKQDIIKKFLEEIKFPMTQCSVCTINQIKSKAL